MIISNCLCKNKSKFIPYIEYKNEKVFKEYEGIKLIRCLNCNLLKTIYPKDHKTAEAESRPEQHEKSKAELVKAFEKITKIIKKYKKRGRVLDVGCSSGIFMEVLNKKSYAVSGIEANKQAYVLAREKFPHQVFLGTLTQYLRKNVTKFDIVIYNHVLEHIPNLVDEFKAIKKILHKKGLLVLGLPNTDNIVFKLRKKYWESLMPSEHLWHFSKNYIKNYLTQNGFKILDVSFSNHARKDYSLIKKIYFNVLTTINKLINSGESMLIISKYDN